MMKRTLSFLIVCISFCSSSACAVPAIPNTATVKGKVLECSSKVGHGEKQPLPVLYRMRLKVESVESRDGAPNFLTGREGQVITVWSSAKLCSGFAGKQIEGIVEYRGDEHGGAFWISELQVLNGKVK